MKRSQRIAAVLTALSLSLSALTLSGSAYRAPGEGEEKDVVKLTFRGDASLVEEYVDREVRSVSDGDYTLSVDGSLTDGLTAYALLYFEPKNEAAEDRLIAEPNLYEQITLAAVLKDGTEAPCELDSYAIETYYKGGPRYMWLGLTLPDGAETAETLRIRHPWMEEDVYLELPLSPIPGYDLSMEQKGTGFCFDSPTGLGEVTLTRVRISPFGLRLTFDYPAEQGIATPYVLLHMSEGYYVPIQHIGWGTDRSDANQPDGAAVLTGSMDFTDHTLRGPDEIAGIVFGGREWPLDGGAPKNVTMDPFFTPFSVPAYPYQGKNGVSYMVSVRELADALGADCTWDNAAKAATVTYQGVSASIPPNADMVQTTDGQHIVGSTPRDYQGMLVVDPFVFEAIWDLVVIPFGVDHGDGDLEITGYTIIR